MEKRTLKDKKIVRVENDTTILNINVEIFRSYFDGIVDGLKIKRCKISKEHSDSIVNAIKILKNIPALLK